MRKENFNLLFAKRSRLLKSGEAAIFMRITANGTRVECNTGKSISLVSTNDSESLLTRQELQQCYDF